MMRAHDVWRGAKGLSKYHMGVGLASEDVVNDRKNVCLSCKYIKNPKPDLKGSKCKLCGCLIRAKTALRQETCPKNKW